MVGLSSMKHPGKHFLVIATTGSGIGDALMGTPALRSLRESFPESAIHLLVNSKRKELFQGNPNIDRILGYRNNWLIRSFLFWRTFFSRYDFVLVFHANEDLWKILKMIRYRECHNRQGFENSARKIFSLNPLPQHSIEKRLALVERVGGKKSSDYSYEYFLPEEAAGWREGKLKEWGIAPGEKLLGLQMGAADRYKCWPLDSFVELARKLRAKHRLKIYLNASAKERDLVKQFQTRFSEGGVFYWEGGTLWQSAVLISACSLFVTNDTGPMHMAIGLGVPLVALFCPSDSLVTGPLHNSRSIVIRKEKPCNPCLYRRCPDPFCMNQISVDEVFQAADQILRRGPTP
jgi:ADP-heptose:LPS heptosyltransferase